MIKKNIILALVLITGMISLSCKNEADAGPRGSLSPIVDAVLPPNGFAGQAINFTVSHAVYNGCGQYAFQETDIVGFSVRVTFYAHYSGGACTTDIPIRKTNYKFIPTQPGTYTIEFNKGETGYLIKTIRIY